MALAAIKGIQTTSQISATFEVHPTQVGLWKKQALVGLSEVFTDKRRKTNDDHEALVAELYKTIGQRDMELAWLKKISNGLSLPDRRSFIQSDHATLSISRQSELVGVVRSGLYYESVVSKEDIRIMNALDEIFTACPFYGSRRMVVELGRTYEIHVCRDHVRRLKNEKGLAI
mgnify:CR=1 FL=1